jgi:3-hydroxybutyryl-CoA dehydrogenase
MRMTVIGGGVMGSGIAQVLAVSGFDVKLNDVDASALERARQSIEDGAFGMRASVARKKLSLEEFEAARKRLHYTVDLQEACAETECLIEAVPEDLTLKMRMFKKFDKFAPARAILTSNTAGLPIAAMANVTERPSLVMGWHWSQPCIVIRMAEIIVHRETDPAAVNLVKQLAVRCGKNPVVVKDNPSDWGFVANRIMREVRREAQRIVDEGVATPDEVDALMKDCFRWPMGVFEMQRVLKS